MTIARSILIDRSDSGIYHCLSRCVRRAFLCGDGYDHRRQWIRHRLQELTDVFAIDIGAYAIMSNHLHVVSRTDPERAAAWKPIDVVERWSRLFPQSVRRRAAELSGNVEVPLETAIRTVASDADRVAVYRDRLSDLSWFMKCLKEPIARRANREDGCTGCFWEGRFKSHALLDDRGLLTCMVYVDLNVVRALIADTPEESDYTSVQDRIAARQDFERTGGSRRRPSRRVQSILTRLPAGSCPRSPEHGLWLAPIDDQAGGACRRFLPLTLDQYLQVVDASGRLTRQDKHGTIGAEVRPILERLEIDEGAWADVMRRVGGIMGTAIGGAAARAAEAARRGRRWVVGAMDTERVLPAATC